MLGLGRRIWMITMIAGIFGISWASVSALADRLPVDVEIPSLRELASGILPKESQEVRVVRVIDGDTFVASIDGERKKVRILSIDTPESVKRNTPVECYALKASHFTKQRLSGETVKLVFDVDRKDKYGRVLAYVELNGQDFGERLIKRGLAKTMTIAPNLSRSFTYAREEKRARRADRGLWGACER